MSNSAIKSAYAMWEYVDFSLYADLGTGKEFHWVVNVTGLMIWHRIAKHLLHRAREVNLYALCPCQLGDIKHHKHLWFLLLLMIICFDGIWWLEAIPIRWYQMVSSWETQLAFWNFAVPSMFSSVSIPLLSAGEAYSSQLVLLLLRVRILALVWIFVVLVCALFGRSLHGSNFYLG